jgi:ATP-dependent exoDNAse (exonuclease V) alpha subunit
MDVFKNCVHQTMNEIEQDMQTRIRTQGQYDDRDTESLLWTDFIHQTARPVEGYPPDPHLHCHAFTFNVTYDAVEERFKAGQFHNIKRDMPYYQARFQKRLADALSSLGYGIRKTENGFEVAVIPQTAIDHFSKRTNYIGQVAKEKGIVDPQQLDELGAKTRGKKDSSLSMSQLQERWREQLATHGIDEYIKSEIKTTKDDMTPKKAVNHAIDHVFTRSSVKRERQILSQAYLHAIDNTSISMDAMDQALKKDNRVFTIQSGSDRLCTTELVLKEERTMVRLARGGLGKVRPFATSLTKNAFKRLGQEQHIALNHILSSQDKLIMIKGGAGTGKTTLIKYAVNEIEKADRRVTLLAPTARATHDVLKSEGFDNTNTVARFLRDEELQNQANNQVIWVDEAGMLGTSDMASILEIAKDQNARVILSGDPRQHSAVDRGDAMRILKTVGQIPQASLEHIYRQKQDSYKQAVEHISKGNIASGFKQLDSMNVIREVDYAEIAEQLTSDYLKLVDGKKSALVVTPTREQADHVSKHIRSGLREREILKKREKRISIIENRHYTEAEKKDNRMYYVNDIIQAHQNMKGLPRGQTATINRVSSDHVYIQLPNGKIDILDQSRPHHFDVFRQNSLFLSKGDEIRITKNSLDEHGKRLNNGTVLTVKNIDQDGRITGIKHSTSKKSEFTLSPNFQNLNYAYCSTSYSTQGKTVDHVLINQPSTTFPASNQKQFYVSVSRGREGVIIYTDDKENLLKSITQSGDRQGATELVQEKDLIGKSIDINRSMDISNKPITQKPNKDYERDL